MNPDLGPYSLLPDFLEFMIYGDHLILAAAVKTLPEEYFHDRCISHGSLHKLLVHAMGAQWVWLNRFRGTPIPLPAENDFPTREALSDRWPQVHDALRDFLAQQTLASLRKPLSFRNFRGEEYTALLGDLFLHVTDHGTYHRGQQNTLLKLAGGAPVDVFFYKWRVANPI